MTSEDDTEILAEMAIIFVILLLATSVLAGIGFCIRKFVSQFSQKAHVENLSTPVSAKADIQSSSETKHETTPKKLDPDDSAFVEAKPTGVGLVQEGFVYGKDSNSSNYHYMDNWEETPSTTNVASTKTEDVKVEKLDIFYDEIDTPGFIDTAMSKFLRSQFNTPVETTKSKIKYSFRQLHGIGQDLVPLENKGSKKLKMSQVMQYTVPLPTTTFGSWSQANTEIGRIRKTIESPTTLIPNKCIAVLTLLSIGGPVPLHPNPNHYLPAFAVYMQSLLEYNYIWEVMQVINQSAQNLLIEMVAIYLWAHVKYEPGKVSKEGGFKPMVHTRASIFNQILNFIVGIGRFDNSINSRMKVYVLLKEMASNTECNEHEILIPMLSESVCISQESFTRYRFYEALQLIIRKHGQCCIQAYFHNTNRHVEVKMLVQHGLWIENDDRIRAKAHEIYQGLLKYNPEIASWLHDSSGEQIYTGTQISVSENLTHSTPGMPLGGGQGPSKKRTITPGSWKVDFPTRK